MMAATSFSPASDSIRVHPGIPMAISALPVPVRLPSSVIRPVRYDVRHRPAGLTSLSSSGRSFSAPSTMFCNSTASVMCLSAADDVRLSAASPTAAVSSSCKPGSSASDGQQRAPAISAPALPSHHDQVSVLPAHQSCRLQSPQARTH